MGVFGGICRHLQNKCHLCCSMAFCLLFYIIMVDQLRLFYHQENIFKAILLLWFSLFLCLGVDVLCCLHLMWVFILYLGLDN